MNGIRYVACIMFVVALVLLPLYIYGYLYTHYALGSLVADGTGLVVFGGLIYFTRHQSVFGHGWITSRLKKMTLSTTSKDRTKSKWVLVAIIAGAVVAGYLKYTQFTTGHATKCDVITAALIGIAATLGFAALQTIDWVKEYVARNNLLDGHCHPVRKTRRQS